MTYLKRYEAGEYEAVWAELRALGEAALDGETLNDARAVADATMRRVLANLRRIEADLRDLGYAFGDVAPAPIDAGTAISNTMRSAEETARSLGLPPEMVEQMLAQARMALGAARPQLDAIAQSVPSVPSMRARQTALGDPVVHYDQIDAYERKAGLAPLALASFWRIVGWCDFAGRWPAPLGAGAGEPLLVMPPAMLADSWEDFVEDNGDVEGFSVELLGDPRPVDGLPWPLIEVAMTSGADLRLPGGEWFVDYLRKATRAAGFPGTSPAGLPELTDIVTGWEPF